MNADTFVKNFTPLANRMAEIYKVPALVILTIGGVESQWGAKAHANNFFGMTAGSNYTGKTVVLTNRSTGKKYTFRAYDTVEQGFEDFCRNLANSSRYQNAFNYVNSPESFIKKMIEGGYNSENPNYYSFCMSILKSVKRRVQ